MTDYAKEMGIDVSLLETERPDHPYQRHMKHVLNRKASEYWARERFLARLGDGCEDGADLRDTDEYVWQTVEGIAAELFVAKSTVYKMIRDGLLPSKRDGESMLRVSRTDLDELRESLSRDGKDTRRVLTREQLKVLREYRRGGGSV